MSEDRPYKLVKSRDVKETDDTHINLRDYNTLLQFTSLWYIRLGHLGLNLFKKTVKIINNISNLNVVKEKDFVCLTYDRSKTVKKLNLKVLLNLLKILDILKKNTFKVKPKLYNKRPIKLLIIDCKLQIK